MSNCIAMLLLIVASNFQTPGKDLNLNKGLAIQGFDPVSYFSEGGPRVGKSEFKATYEGATYYFINQENKEKFLANPAQFKPEYGGWCAYAMGASGEKVKIDPETYKIVDGKLYLFYNFFFNNTLDDWNENEKQLKVKADENWAKIIKN